jgi:phosphinothricin acetyltransferase
VARSGDEIVGWAALSPVQRKSAYQGVAEVSIYVAEGARGSGVARALAEATIAASEREGIWTLEAWIFPENRASLALCEALGFRVVGIRERIGRLHGRWRDVVIVERRSASVGA